MAIADKPDITAQALSLADELTDTAQRLCRSTVQVRGEGPGGGSGVIWSADGVIITNAHVARGSRATVELSDGRTLAATITARDKVRDLAALTVDATDLPAATVGDSDALRVGELVLAVGNPLGMVGALTTGIVHTIAPAEGPQMSKGQSWVQADVRLAPGNSGGPLANARGHVIGINSMITGGLALAVPSNAVQRFLQGRGERPYLGVTTQPVLLPLGGRRAFGLLVLETDAGGPAEAAGLLTGDVLVGAGDARFREPDDLASALYRAGIGATLSFAIVRGGQRITRDVVVGGHGARSVEEAA